MGEDVNRILQTLLPQLPRQISRPQVVVALVLCSVVWSSQKKPQAAGRGHGGLGVALEHLNDGLCAVCNFHKNKKMLRVSEAFIGRENARRDIISRRPHSS